MTSSSPSAVFQYPRIMQLTIDWPLLPVALCAFFANAFIREGLTVAKGLAFCGFGAALFTFIWYSGRADLITLTVDDEGLQSKAFWGLVQRSLSWSDIEKVEYDTIVDRMHGFTGPKTYFFTRRSQPKRFGRKFRSLVLSEKLIGFPELITIIERRSAEFGFPIMQMK